MPRKSLIAALFLSLVASVVPAGAAEEGREDLNKAMEAKLTADSIDDLNEVVRLIESALEKGLDEANAAFAKKLLASTFFLRAQDKINNIMVGIASMEEFHQRRLSALEDLRKAVKLDPNQPQAYLKIARLQLLPGGEGAKAAREALDKALALHFDNPPERAEALVLRANLQEAPEKKLADLDEAVRLAPHAAAAVRARGLALADMDKLEAALADLDKAIALDPNDVPTYESKALVLAELKKYDDALAVLDKALVVKPDNAAVLLLRSEVNRKAGKMEQALADVEKVLQIKPGLVAALRARALLLAEEERFAEAILELEKLKENDPSDLLTLLQLGLFYNADKQSDKAVECFSAILSVDANLWQALRGRGDAYLNLGKHAEAVADYEKALKLEPDDPGILNNLAWVLATSPDDKIRDGKRAVELAAKACKATDYKLPHILSTLAAACAEGGDFDSAVKWSAKAVELDEKHEHGDALKKELESYKAKKPWRELLSEETAEENQ
ncbi:MAG: tetratricopeptide repeat protein [Pirellulales bacterium]|nr:tetratricopeptide repeat protein [Pirellulales bacterium]